MIQLINAFKEYQNHHKALSNINLRINNGEMVFLTGHSGAGKSTLLKLIMMAEFLSHGKLLVNGYDLENITKRHIPIIRKQIGMIFQTPQLLHNKSIFDNVALPLSIAGFRPKEIKRRVRAALDKVGLLNKEKNFPLQLSSGEQQRTGIARAIVSKPKIILADEPTGNLDPKLSTEILQLFCAFNDVGVTTLIASHDLSLIKPLNKRIIVLNQGQIHTDTGRNNDTLR
jgi:cell division transport system ATP-binding protein